MTKVVISSKFHVIKNQASRTSTKPKTKAKQPSSLSKKFGQNNFRQGLTTDYLSVNE